MIPPENREESLSLPELNEAFGKVIRERRNALGLRLIDLQLDDGLDRSHIGKIESGKVQVCLRGIFSLAVALETEPAVIISEVWNRINAPDKPSSTKGRT